MNVSAPTPLWMKITITRVGSGVKIRAEDSRRRETGPFDLAAPWDVMGLSRFAEGVRAAARADRPIDQARAVRAEGSAGESAPGDLLLQAKDLGRALLVEGIREMRGRLREAAGDAPLLLRLSIEDPDLQAVPWEAIAAPDGALGFWGSSPDLFPVRHVPCEDLWVPHEVGGALRVLVVAPGGPGGTLAMLRDALQARIASGQIELDSLEGDRAAPSGLVARLRTGPVPHVLHFIGHGGVGADGPVLQLADAGEDDELWMSVELIGQQLRAGTRGQLRLVLLESCEGGRPALRDHRGANAGDRASAAEILAKAGADAVVSNLWVARANVARRFSCELYSALLSPGPGGGGIAFAVNEARRCILGDFHHSGAAFSPLLHLRAQDPVLFKLGGARPVVAPRRPAAESTAAAGGLAPALSRLLAKPFSLLIGDHGREEQAALDDLRARLGKAWPAPPPPEMALSALAQWFAFKKDPEKLRVEFQKVFASPAAAAPLLDALARRATPGVHTTLLRRPLLEHALAEHHPDRAIYVLQPDVKSTTVLRRARGEQEWEDRDESPRVFEEDAEDPDTMFVLRLYRGFRPDTNLFTPPLLTEDDYLFGFRDIKDTLPEQIADRIRETLYLQPALIAGLSLLSWDHRVLLRRLFGNRQLPADSLVILDPSSPERQLWDRGDGLPGNYPVAVVEAAAEDLARSLLEDAP